MGGVHKRVVEGGMFRWEGVEAKRYEGGGASAGTRRHVLAGPRDGARHFCIRYFEVPEGGHTSFEHHLHDHGVFILEGRARLVLGGEVYEIEVGDVVYIAQNEQHQSRASVRARSVSCA